MYAWEYHPALVHFPIAFFIGGVLLDIYAWRNARADLARVATGLLIAGVATGVLTAIAGVVAFYTVPSTHTERAHDQMPWHIGLAVTMFVLFTGVALVRWRHRDAAPADLTRAVELVAVLLLLVAAYLGGTMVYHGGTGVDSTIMASSLHHDHGGGGGSGGSTVVGSR